VEASNTHVDITQILKLLQVLRYGGLRQTKLAHKIIGDARIGFSKCSMIAIRAGCPNALAITAIWFCFSVNRFVFVTPLSQYCD